MVAGESTQRAPAVPSGRSLPPVSELAIGSLALIVIGGIYLAGYFPRTTPLFPAVALLAGSGILLVTEVAMLGRVRQFAWHRFFQVFTWALAAYAIMAGMIGYAFVTDGVRGSLLVLLVLMLLVYAVDIPLLLAFSVARYAESDA